MSLGKRGTMRERNGKRQVWGCFSMCCEHVLPFGVCMKDCSKQLTNFTFLVWVDVPLAQHCIQMALYGTWALHEFHELRYEGGKVQAGLGSKK